MISKCSVTYEVLLQDSMSNDFSFSFNKPVGCVCTKNRLDLIILVFSY